MNSFSNKIVAVVPIKFNSRRLNEKCIKRFKNGKPLCYYIFNELLKIKEIQLIYAFCSDERIIPYLPDNVIFLKRPEYLDEDNISINDILYQFISNVEADIYIQTHITSPFLSHQSILSGLSAVLTQNYDSAFSVTMCQDFFWSNGKPINYRLSDVPRTQDLVPFYKETSGFYIFKRNVFESTHGRIGSKPFLVEVNQIEAIDIDTEEDFFIADAIYNFNR